MNEPRLVTPVILALLACLCLVPAWKASLPDWLRFLLAAAGFVLLFFAAVATLEWIVYYIGSKSAEIVYRLRQAQHHSPDLEIILALAKLTPWQAELYAKRAAAIIAIPGVAGSTLYYEIDGEQIPAEFVTEYLDASQEHLKPIRDYAEGSQGRAWAVALTQFFVNRGLARPAVGNLPAQWTYGYDQAAAWFALTEEP